MATTIRQRVTVKPGGLIEIRSPELREGESADVIVRVESAKTNAQKSLGGLERFAAMVNSGDKHSSDNTKIDEDLAREYSGQNDRLIAFRKLRTSLNLDGASAQRWIQDVTAERAGTPRQ
jgi:hypothetical protein